MTFRPFIALAFTLLPSAAFAASPLADAPSAFLRAHADSPVHWLPWGDAAFKRAAAENKPVFLNIGTATSELSRAMRVQSFAREEIAASLNENFICVLVDRDERGDLAALYQTYLRVVKQSQGWPLNLWLTPGLKPFDGASYLPPSDEWGKEGFTNVMKRVLATWQADPVAQQRKADDAVTTVAGAVVSTPPRYDVADVGSLLADGAQAWRSTFDPNHGGFGDPPKHPEPELLRFLLRTDDVSRDAALATLRALASSPMRDPLDGGFFRYSSDAEWRLPYFQKSLGAQAQMALAYLDAAKISGDATYATVARDALRYALTLGDVQHGFTATADGTPEGITPSFLWTFGEIRDALGVDEANEFARLTGAIPDGNLAPDAYLGVETAGKNLLASPDLATDAKTAERFARATEKLRARRAQRPTPSTADAASSGAHGLLLTALTRAGAACPDEKLTTAARDLAGYVRGKLLSSDGKLLAIAGRPTLAGPRDHALVIDGLLTFATATDDAPSKKLALALLTQVQSTLADAKSGHYFVTAETLGTGVWSRVHAVPLDASDTPGAETAMLLTLVGHDLGEPAQRDMIASAIARDVNEAPTIARGDQLLALQTFALKR